MSKHGITTAHNHVHNRHNRIKIHYAPDDKFIALVYISLTIALLIGVAIVAFK